jgi:cytochrome P450
LIEFILFVTDNQIIRKGTPVVIFIHGILHDANVYPHPEHFDPERFAEGSKMSNERSQFDYIPFSIGSRNCIGK